MPSGNPLDGFFYPTITLIIDSSNLRFYPGIENLILPMQSYQGRQVTSSYEIASWRIQGLLEAYFKINK